MTQQITRVIVESPYAGDLERNIAYARFACWWCLKQGMAPFASHLLYTQCLDDRDADERALGMRAGMAWRHGASQTMLFTDFGISKGMIAGETHAKAHGQIVSNVSLKKIFGEQKFHEVMRHFKQLPSLYSTVDYPGNTSIRAKMCDRCSEPIPSGLLCKDCQDVLKADLRPSSGKPPGIGGA